MVHGHSSHHPKGIEVRCGKLVLYGCGDFINDYEAVLSQPRGDFELTVGQDFSIGYLAHTESTVRLFLQESFTFRSIAPEAVVPLSYAER